MADMNITELNDKSLDLLAQIAGPYFTLLKDPEFMKRYLKNTMDGIQYACEHYKAETVEIAAALDGKTPDEYIVNPFTLPLKIAMAVGMYSKINSGLFTSAEQNKEGVSFGSASVNTEAPEQPNIS